MELSTRAVHVVNEPLPPGSRPLSVPLVQSSAFAFESAAELADAMAGPDGAYVYSRRGNPTVRALEQTLAGLEGGAGAIAFASGMGAVSGVLLALLRPGDRVVAQRCLYGGTHAVLADLAERFGIEVVRIAGDDPAEFEAAATHPATRLLLLETIANPTGQVPDLPGLLAAARALGVVGLVDNSLASPVLCRPLEHGADIVVHSTTKYLSGHSDVLGGAAVFADDELRRRIWPRTVELGACADPFAAWLTLRGTPTLPLRMRAHCANAAVLAERLAAHPGVSAVHYPGLPGHPSYERAREVLDGGGGLLSFELAGGREAGRAFIERVRLARLALSLGGVETLVTHPASTSHRELDGDALEAAGIAPGLVRMSVGIEDVEDLWSDVEQALGQSLSGASFGLTK
ncbi:aminotransferase class I/II-fold pyridoxal phosphate-dependent enzyme [Streptomyces sp. TX20-6-3]|uniref:trans-sulfuration enzyme family protein n=1 Tax=Streptomyces sp. TX20-6-3 TaxID=3028705 RepID=UPI0029B07995|nr:aminotransferase class I/II-fold pyridoxal phosphate-dependent enzyme [Streptomyces sp. TX20-6-3]MDX2560224.1 aminotransferase class I/II-fold pyridoxal phosphate-dependent enzyme [Streptomyces sp. TX20-6-3]